MTENALNEKETKIYIPKIQHPQILTCNQSSQLLNSIRKAPDEYINVNDEKRR